MRAFITFITLQRVRFDVQQSFTFEDIWKKKEGFQTSPLIWALF